MSQFRIERVHVLPDPVEPSTMYIVKGENPVHAEVHFTGSNSEIRRILNRNDVQTMINEATVGLANMLITENIASRDAMNLQYNALVLVMDASDDETVDSGSALYIFDYSTLTFRKVSEFESLDVSSHWDDIKGKPTSSPAQIDEAVSNSHTHTNMDTLNKLTEGAQGNLLYNGSGIKAAIEISDW